jgi:hypothetical protein
MKAKSTFLDTHESPSFLKDLLAELIPLYLDRFSLLGVLFLPKLRWQSWLAPKATLSFQQRIRLHKTNEG